MALLNKESVPDGLNESVIPSPTEMNDRSGALQHSSGNVSIQCPQLAHVATGDLTWGSDVRARLAVLYQGTNNVVSFDAAASCSQPQTPAPAYHSRESLVDFRARKSNHAKATSAAAESLQADPEKDTKISTSYYCAISSEDLNAIVQEHPMPSLKGNLQWTKFRYDTASVYRRLWATAILVNVLVILVMIVRCVQSLESPTYGSAATGVGVNLVIATLMRQEHCVNLLFHLATILPHWTPLSIRACAAKVYSYGGVHSGCGISALFWYIFYMTLLSLQFRGSTGHRNALYATTALTLFMLLVITCLAHPTFRRRYHDQWEISHRFCGWSAIALVWAQTIILASAKAEGTGTPMVIVLCGTPSFWFLISMTCCIIYPWMRLRYRRCVAQRLSDHALRLSFNDRRMPTCVGYRVSSRPLIENHGFATIPNDDNEAKGYSIIVSNAGDWTNHLINHPPSRIWTRGVPTIGVMRVGLLFSPLVVVTTGSGIGPCLSFLKARPDYPVRVIWSARAPTQTYGENIMFSVLRADPQALIVDTRKTKMGKEGNPNLSELTWALCRQTQAEAMVIISNPFVTRKTVFDLESRGMAAFGAVFDS